MDVVIRNFLRICKRLRKYSLMLRPSSYTTEEAALRMGITRQAVSKRVKAGTLKVKNDPDASTVRLDAVQVDAFRALRLAKFSDVVDTTELADDIPTRLANAEARARSASTWLKVSSASEQLLEEGLRKIADSRRLLSEALIGALPDDGRVRVDTDAAD